MNEELIQAFHAMWDSFPGPVRLISKNHIILASNSAAQAKGFLPGCACSRVGAPETHRECKLVKALRTGQAQYDRTLPDRIRGWIPLRDYPDTVIHFTIMIPEETGEQR